MTYERKRIFILVKTYPTASKRYRETVCTAGIQEDGTWIRLYPVRFPNAQGREEISQIYMD